MKPGRASDCILHYLETLLNFSGSEKSTVPLAWNIIQIFLHVFALLADYLIYILQLLVLEDLCWDSGEQKGATKRNHIQVAHFGKPDWIGVVKSLVVTVAYSCDRRGNHVDTFKIAFCYSCSCKFDGVHFLLALNEVDDDPSAGKIMDAQQKLETSQKPGKQVHESVPLQVEYLAKFVKKAFEGVLNLVTVSQT